MPAPTPENYDADRLGDDVLAVIDALKLHRPILAGHSIAGEELSSIGTRHPDKVSGLVYLDAASVYAFYLPGETLESYTVESASIRRNLFELLEASPSRSRELVQEIQTTLPHLQKSLNFVNELLVGMPDGPSPRVTVQYQVSQAIFRGQRKYSDIRAPILAIAASPPACQPRCDTAIAKAIRAATVAQIGALEKKMPSARVVRLPFAPHYVFRSNEADVIGEMTSFMDDLR